MTRCPQTSTIRNPKRRSRASPKVWQKTNPNTSYLLDALSILPANNSTNHLLPKKFSKTLNSATASTRRTI